MTHLNIQQGLNIEVVSTNLIKKLYEAALSVPEPLEGELDAAYMSGNLLVNRSYRALVEYLTNRFDDLHINVTDSYYIPFEDSNVLSVLLANNIGADGIGITEDEAVNATIGTAFRENTTITSFDSFGYFTKANNLPANGMFEGCTNLESIDLSNMTSMTTYQFRLTAITDVNVPNLISYTGYNLFTGCNQLKTVTSLGHISVIPTGCFNSADNLETVNLPDECISIEMDGFSPSLNGSGSLTEVNGIDHVLNFGYLAFYRLFNLHLYSQDLYNATNIEQRAFWYVKVHSIDCPNLTSLGGNAFRENSVLTSIECLGKISSIPVGCFMQDTALQTVKIPYECTSIEDSAFLNCSSLTSITLYNKSLDDYVEGENPVFNNLSRVTIFGNSCFENCTLLSLTLQDIQNATTINNGAFRGVSSLSGTLNLPNLTVKIGSNAFLNTNISSISSLGSVTEIGDNAFGNTNISSITIPNSVTKCASTFVSNTIVPEIIFPEGVELVSGGLFYTKNNSLTYVEIPSTVTNMNNFFHRSLETSQNDLCTVVIKATTPPTLMYYKNNANLTRGDKFSGIYVPDASLTAYQNAANAWQHSSIQAKLKPISQLQTDNPTAWAKYNRV